MKTINVKNGKCYECEINLHLIKTQKPATRYTPSNSHTILLHEPISIKALHNNQTV